MRRHPLFCAVVLLFFALAGSSEAGLKIYYIRHIECGHNVVRDWKGVPRDQWPAYVGDENRMTPRGEAQAASVPEKLAKYHFDFIAVSPMWRTRQTILPYLRANHLQAEIWPELHECAYPGELMAADLPRPSPGIFGRGKEITVAPQEAPFFRLREDGLRECRVKRGDALQYSADMRAVFQSAFARLLKRFGGTEESVLLVGHGSQGLAFLRMILKDPSVRVAGIKNIGVWMVEEQPDGRFKLEMFNDEPVRSLAAK